MGRKLWPHRSRGFVVLSAVSLLVVVAAPVGVSAPADGRLAPASIVDDTVPEPATGGATPDRVDRAIARQAPIIKARTELESTASASGDDGLAVINADHDAGRLDVYWKGGLPASVRTAVERARERFTVVVHDAPYSWTEMATEARRVLAEVKRRPGFENVVATSPEHDMSGIRILVSQPPIAPATALSQLDSNMPLRFETTPLRKPKPATGWRWDDLPPWTGGAVIERTELLGIRTIRCSTAFTARTDDDSIRGVFTARHCGENESWRTAVGEGPVGVSSLWFSDIDVMGIMVPTSSPAYLGFEGRVFSGVYNGDVRRGLTGSSWSGLNDIVCTSGGYTGSNCRQQVFDRNLFFEEPFGGPLFATAQLDGLAAVGQGDSGGPVYTAGSGATATAHGVISAISQGDGRATECMGWVPDGRECSDWALHAELQPVLDTLGMQVIHWAESDSAPSAAPASGGPTADHLTGGHELAPGAAGVAP